MPEREHREGESPTEALANDLLDLVAQWEELGIDPDDFVKCGKCHEYMVTQMGDERSCACERKKNGQSEVEDAFVDVVDFNEVNYAEYLEFNEHPEYDGKVITFHICPACGEGIPEDTDDAGELTSNNYASHWKEEHER